MEIVEAKAELLALYKRSLVAPASGAESSVKLPAGSRNGDKRHSAEVIVEWGKGL